jgi:ADP-ribosylglycohydrolase
VVTHSHIEGQAGAIAVAVAAAFATDPAHPDGTEFLHRTAALVPVSKTRDLILEASAIPPDQPLDAIRALGTGQRVSAQDTVPFCLWVAAYHLDDFEEAIWCTIQGMGDVDTTCAIVGGIVAMAASQIPSEWLARRESLPESSSA